MTVDLDQLQLQAEALAAEYGHGSQPALERVARFLPTLKPQPQLRMAAARYIIAREHGFTNWPTLEKELGNKD